MADQLSSPSFQSEIVTRQLLHALAYSSRSIFPEQRGTGRSENKVSVLTG